MRVRIKSTEPRIWNFRRFCFWGPFFSVCFSVSLFPSLSLFLSFPLFLSVFILTFLFASLFFSLSVCLSVFCLFRRMSSRARSRRRDDVFSLSPLSLLREENGRNGHRDESSTGCLPGYFVAFDSTLFSIRSESSFLEHTPVRRSNRTLRAFWETAPCCWVKHVVKENFVWYPIGSIFIG